MKTEHLILIAALTVMIGLCSGQAARPGSPPASASSITGTATVKGKVKFEGRVPKSIAINMAADASCAKQQLIPVLRQDVVADANGGLKNVIVFIVDGLGGLMFDVPSQPAVIEQKGCMYQPHVLALRANQPLEVVNDDPLPTMSILCPPTIGNGTRLSSRVRKSTKLFRARR